MNLKPSHIEDVITEPDELKDLSLTRLISMTGLKKEFIAKKNDIHPVYLSMLISNNRKGQRTRNRIRNFLINHIISAPERHLALNESKLIQGRRKRAS